MTRCLGLDEPDLAGRFWKKVDRGLPDECWEWLAFCNRSGYGKFSIGGRTGRMEFAHRVAYELAVGPIAFGLTLDHLCRNPSCVNPWHLEPVPHRVNCQRGVAGRVNAARQRSVTHCPQGHAYDEANTGYRPDGRRRCRACDRAYQRRSA